jgi:3-hydroxyacyl-CoA dehydrogenase
MPNLTDDVKITVTGDQSAEMRAFAASGNDIENFVANRYCAPLWNKRHPVGNPGPDS